VRRSLTSVRSRVDRLALKLVPTQAAGCASCRGQEDTPKVVCFYGDEVPDIPTETRCETCGRVIPLRYMTIGYDARMKPDDM
jgi:hypothetical protein